MISDYQRRRLSQAALGKTSLVLGGGGIKIYWGGTEVTSGPGLNSTMHILGMLSHSSRSNWQVLDRRKGYLKAMVTFKDLPLSQVWKLKFKNENCIDLSIDLDVEEFLHIDGFTISCLLEPLYKTWINNYHQGDFPRLSDNWQSIHQDNAPASLIGARFPRKDNLPHAFTLECEGGRPRTLQSIIQNCPRDFNANAISFRNVDAQGKKDYYPGYRNFFTGKIRLFTEGHLLDDKIERLRKCDFQRVMEEKAAVSGKIKVILANIPWEKNGKLGVRAGSRWPHIKDESEGNYLPFPFFLAYSAALLRKHGINASLIDAIAERIPEGAFIEKISSSGSGYLVAETSVPSFYNDLGILSRISKSGISIILCGPNSEIYNPEFLKQHGVIEFVLYGEYEFTLLELIECLEEGGDLSDVKGLIYRKGEEIIKTSPRENLDVNLLPWPYLDGLPMDKYCDIPGDMPMPSVQMLASRGCLFRCNFCLWPQVMYREGSYRVRDVEDVVDEMEYLVREKKFKSVYFDDDTFNINKKRMLDFCRLIKERGLQDISWAIMARADLMDKETLTAMKSAGLWAVKYGVESFNRNFIKSCGKALDLSKTEKIIKLTSNLGIRTHLTFCFGFPGETRETIRKTVERTLGLSPYSVQFSILTPFPGTRLFGELEKQGRILTRDWARYDGHYDCVFKPDSLEPEELVAAKNEAYHLWKDAAGGKKSLSRAAPPEEKVIFSVLKTANRILRDYPDIMGIFNGGFAFKGPSYVQIDLTNSCNNNCIACWCNSPLLGEMEMPHDMKKQTLPFTLVKGLLDELRYMGTKDIYFSGGGEPFMHPQIMEILEYAKKSGFACLVNTNFTLLDEEKIKRLVSLGVDHLTVSTWAATAATYALTHPNKSEDAFRKMADDLKFLNKIKQKLPHITLYNVICNANYHELKGMITLAKETGSESLEFTLIDTIPGKTDKLALSLEQVDELRKQAREITHCLDANGCFDGIEVCRFDLFLRRISSFSDISRATYDRNIIGSMPCYIGWCFSRIMANGDVNACLKAHRIPTGNLYKQSFRKIWNGKPQFFFRKKTMVYEKNDPFFRLIGNDPGIKEAGCYKSCDDIGRNMHLHNRIKSLSPFERKIAKILAKVMR